MVCRLTLVLTLANEIRPQASTPAAESRSKNSVACGWRRRNEAGQAVLIGPCNAFFTALAFRFSGAMQSIRFAAPLPCSENGLRQPVAGGRLRPASPT